MTPESISSLAAWFKDRASSISKYGSVTMPEVISTAKLVVPETYGRVVVLTDCLLAMDNDSQFQGGILAVQNHEIWSETATIGLFDNLRSTKSGSQVSVSEFPGTIFEIGENDAAYYLLLFCLLGKWDASFVPAHERYLLNISHDSILTISFRDIGATQTIEGWLSRSKFDVQSIIRTK